MNERIQKLMWDAGLNSNYVEGFDSIYSEQLKKFAELIVRDLIDSMIKRYGDDDELPIQEIKSFVKEHFGVEE